MPDWIIMGLSTGLVANLISHFLLNRSEYEIVFIIKKK